MKNPVIFITFILICFLAVFSFRIAEKFETAFSDPVHLSKIKPSFVSKSLSDDKLASVQQKYHIQTAAQESGQNNIMSDVEVVKKPILIDEEELLNILSGEK